MPPPHKPLHKDVQIKCVDKCWLSLVFPIYHTVMSAPIDMFTATANLERLNATTIEYRLFRTWLGRPGNEKLIVEGPRTFQGGQLYTECTLFKDVEHNGSYINLQINSRLTNNGLAVLIFFYIFVFCTTVLLGISGNMNKILVAWLFLGMFYLFQMQYLRWANEEVYNFVSNWLMESDWVMPQPRSS